MGVTPKTNPARDMNRGSRFVSLIQSFSLTGENPVILRQGGSCGGRVVVDVEVVVEVEVEVDVVEVEVVVVEEVVEVDVV